MIAEIAVAASLSGAAIGYMIGKASKAAMFAHAESRVALARARADDWHASYVKVRNEYLSAIGELNAIKKQRSDIVRRGNITRRLKREAAAKVSA